MLVSSFSIVNIKKNLNKLGVIDKEKWMETLKKLLHKCPFKNNIIRMSQKIAWYYLTRKSWLISNKK